VRIPLLVLLKKSCPSFVFFSYPFSALLLPLHPTSSAATRPATTTACWRLRHRRRPRSAPWLRSPEVAPRRFRAPSFTPTTTAKTATKAKLATTTLTMRACRQSILWARARRRNSRTSGPGRGYLGVYSPARGPRPRAPGGTAIRTPTATRRRTRDFTPKSSTR